MLEIVDVVFEGTLRVVRRIDENAFHPAGVKRHERLERIKVVALDEPIARLRVTYGFSRLQEAIRNAPRSPLGTLVPHSGIDGHSPESSQSIG